MGYLKVPEWSSREGIVYGFGVREKTTGEMTKKDFWGHTIREGSGTFPLVALRQVHGDCVIHFTEEGEKLEDIWAHEGDALITRSPGFALSIFTADCLPILLFDPEQKAIGAVHAGWRGTAKRIARKAITELKEKFNCRTKDIQAALGPCIGPCCYEVDQPVRDTFLEEGWPWDLIANPRGPGRWSLNLSLANVLLLEEAGVRKENVHPLEYCTFCRQDLFCSYRREEKTKGRQLNFIALKKS
jgi:polyphenol oxidase